MSNSLILGEVLAWGSVIPYLGIKTYDNIRRLSKPHCRAFDRLQPLLRYDCPAIKLHNGLIDMWNNTPKCAYLTAPYADIYQFLKAYMVGVKLWHFCMYDFSYVGHMPLLDVVSVGSREWDDMLMFQSGQQIDTRFLYLTGSSQSDLKITWLERPSDIFGAIGRPVVSSTAKTLVVKVRDTGGQFMFCLLIMDGGIIRVCKPDARTSDMYVNLNTTNIQAHMAVYTNEVLFLAIIDDKAILNTMQFVESNGQWYQLENSQCSLKNYNFLHTNGQPDGKANIRLLLHENNGREYMCVTYESTIIFFKLGFHIMPCLATVFPGSILHADMNNDAICVIMASVAIVFRLHDRIEEVEGGLLEAYDISSRGSTPVCLRYCEYKFKGFVIGIDHCCNAFLAVANDHIKLISYISNTNLTIKVNILTGHNAPIIRFAGNQHGRFCTVDSESIVFVWDCYRGRKLARYNLRYSDSDALQSEDEEPLDVEYIMQEEYSKYFDRQLDHSYLEVSDDAYGNCRCPGSDWGIQALPRRTFMTTEEWHDYVSVQCMNLGTSTDEYVEGFDSATIGTPRFTNRVKSLNYCVFDENSTYVRGRSRSHNISRIIITSNTLTFLIGKKNGMYQTWIF